MLCKPAHFLPHQFAVRTLALHQAIRRTVLNDLASFQHDHPVEITQRRETVGNCNHRPAAHQAAERFAYRFLGFAVERGGCFVQ